MSEAIPVTSFEFSLPRERIIKLYGAPGTGKTTALVRIIEHLIGFQDHTEFLENYGLSLPFGQYGAEDVIFMTFQTSALKEFEARTGIKVKDRQNKPGRYYSTVHGIAFRLLIDSGAVDGFITQNFGSLSPEDWFRNFCWQNGLRFESSEMGYSNVFNEGNQLWNALTWAYNVYYPTKGPKARYEALKRLAPKLWKFPPLWEEYKEGKGILDYNDMLIKAYEGLRRGEIDPRNLPGHKYSPKVLIVDEFQDLSPLQFEIFRLLANHMDLVIIAGDDDQTIFSYQGADPRLMNYVPGREIVLRKSHRLPIVVQAKALTVISKTRHRKEKTVAPRTDLGDFKYKLFWFPDFLNDLVREAQEGHSIFILVRTNRQVLKLGKELILAGVHFEHLKVDYRSIWEAGSKGWGTFRDLVQALLKAKNGEELEVADLVTILYYSELIDWHLGERISEKERYKKIAEQMEKTIEAIEKGLMPFNVLKVKENPFSVLDLEKIESLSPRHGKVAVELIKELMKEKSQVVSIPKDARIYLDTLHASKGREADVVFLINDLPRKWSSILKTREELDAERRVWYVGLTRARKKVYLLNGKHPFPVL
ncbi:ATP-dependent helicase [Thermococcus atlanticus]